MTKKEATAYLANAVAEMVSDGCPINPLTGDEGAGRPDRKHARLLAEALEALGYPKAAGEIRREHNIY